MYPLFSDGVISHPRTHGPQESQEASGGSRLQRLLHVRAGSDPGVQGGFHHHGPKQRRLHRQERPEGHVCCFRLPGPINFTVFLTMFGEKLKGADPEETILNAFKVFDPEGKGTLRKDFVTDMLTTQADRFSPEEMEQMFAAFPPDVAGDLDYKNLVYVITHGEEKD
ncbi:unnamed protein product, partial [Tetraodon nigroviridis]